MCLFNIVCSYTNSAMEITYKCRETPNGWNLISRLKGATIQASMHASDPSWRVLPHLSYGHLCKTMAVRDKWVSRDESI